MTKKHWWKYLLGFGALAIVGGVVAGGIVSCSNGSTTTTSSQPTTTTSATPTTTSAYALQKGANQPGLQYTSNAVSSNTSMVATNNTVKNQPGDLDIYAGNGLSAIITPSEIASGETINLTLNLAPGVTALTYSDLLKLPSLIAIQPYQSTSTYTVTQGKTLNMSLNANSSFNVNFKALPSDWQHEMIGTNDTNIYTSAGQFGIYLLANNNDNYPIQFWTGLTSGEPNVLIDNIPAPYMASANLNISINGKSVPIDLSANLQSYFTRQKANDTTDFVNLIYGKSDDATVNIGTRLTTWFWTDVNTANMLMQLPIKKGFQKVAPFILITQTPGTNNQFTILWNVTEVQVS